MKQIKRKETLVKTYILKESEEAGSLTYQFSKKQIISALYNRFCFHFVYCTTTLLLFLEKIK